MKKTTYIREIKPGEKVYDFFFVTEKNLAYSQKGAPYLNLRLKDKTGELDGKVWDNVTELDRAFRKGDFVYLQTRAVQYKNAIQLAVLNARRAEPEEIDAAEFFPAAKEDPERMFQELASFAAGVKTPALRDLLQAFLTDAEIAGPLRRAPAAKGFHHVYIGGLLEHTLSVVRVLDMLADHYEGLNRDLVIAGGILHDIGKIHEYSQGGLIDYTDEGRLIGHVVMGVQMVDRKIATLPDFPAQLAMELRHVLLSHHGALEFGAPKRPKTVEALLVHYVDDLDAKINAMRTFIAGDGNEDSDWTPFHRLLERFLYKGKNAGRGDGSTGGEDRNG
ncbi:MAG: HD domain-containing protein [Pseudomonadota bacterium]|nr:HD domain-containing protein [Pseudomonadota bacterium]